MDSEMVGVRERRRQLEKEKYWLEFDTNRHKFFKVMIGNFRNELKIPRKFVVHFRERLLGTIKLRGPSENLWDVELRRTVGDFLFQNGWGQFVQDHDLALGDFLVFQYNGDSTFNVTIFDNTGCEREASYFIRCSTHKPVLQNKQSKARSFVELDQDLQQKKLNCSNGNKRNEAFGNSSLDLNLKEVRKEQKQKEDDKQHKEGTGTRGATISNSAKACRQRRRRPGPVLPSSRVKVESGTSPEEIEPPAFPMKRWE